MSCVYFLVQRHSPVPHQRHSPISQRHSPIQQRHSPIQKRHSPVPQRRSPVLQRLSPDMHRRSPLPELSDGPASYSCRPTSHHLGQFPGKTQLLWSSRSIGLSTAPTVHSGPGVHFAETSTICRQLPQAATATTTATWRKPAHVSSKTGLSVRGWRRWGFGWISTAVQGAVFPPLGYVPLAFRAQPSTLHPSPQPPHLRGWGGVVLPSSHQSSANMGVLSPLSSSRGPASCSAFPIPSRPNTLSCHPPGYLHAEHAQSWPSINVSRNNIQWPENLPRLIGNVPVITFLQNLMLLLARFLTISKWNV